MKSALFKKSIIVVAAIVFLAGVSLFAYWMSDISAPDEKDEEIPITIGVGAAVGTNLKVKEKLYKEGLNFVPEDRDPDDIVNENSTSEVVFELTIAWIHVDEEGDLIDEQGVLLAAIESFTFYDRSPYEETNKHSVQLTPAQQVTLKKSFTLELLYKEGDNYYPPADGNYLIDPNKNVDDTQKIYLRLTFKEDVTDKEIYNLMKDKLFEIKVTLLLEKTVKKQP